MSKYHARKTEIDGIVFDSRKESERYAELKLLERAHRIRSLVLQPRFELQEGFTNAEGKKIRPITYIADFMYYDCDTGTYVVEDVKGMKTDTYKIKKKLFEYKYGMVVREI